MLRPGYMSNNRPPPRSLYSQSGPTATQPNPPSNPTVRRSLLPGGPNSTLPPSSSGTSSSQQQSNAPAGQQHDSSPSASGQSKLIINNLRSGDVSESQIRELFEPFGRISTVSILSDCVLVRFLRQEDMEKAVRSKDGAQFMGRSLQIESVGSQNSGGGAGAGGSSSGNNQESLFRGRNESRDNKERERGRDRQSRDKERDRRPSPSPVRYDKRAPSPRGRRRSRSRSPQRRGANTSSSSTNRNLPYHRDNRDMSPYSRHPVGRGNSPSGGGGGGGDYHRREERSYGGNSRSPPRDMHRSGMGHVEPRIVTSPPHLPPLDTHELTLVSQRPYDVAIVAMDQSLLPFAESIEARLHSQAPLSTHIIMLREEAHVVPCVSDLTRKGVLFACIVGQQNEKHDSCTLRLLHGTPQEHRNMPMADAMFLVQRQFDDLLRNMAIAEQKLKAQRQTRNTAIDRPPGYVPPTERQTYLLYLLADGRMLTNSELHEVHMFIVARIKAIGGEVPGSQPENPNNFGGMRPVSGAPYQDPYGANASMQGLRHDPQETLRAQTAELQSKILSIINPHGDIVGLGMEMDKGEQISHAAPQHPSPTKSLGNITGAPVVNFDDPKVREALNNLAPFLKGGSGGAPTQPPQQRSVAPQQPGAPRAAVTVSAPYANPRGAPPTSTYSQQQAPQPNALFQRPTAPPQVTSGLRPANIQQSSHLPTHPPPTHPPSHPHNQNETKELDEYSHYFNETNDEGAGDEEMHQGMEEEADYGEEYYEDGSYANPNQQSYSAAHQGYPAPQPRMQMARPPYRQPNAPSAAMYPPAPPRAVPPRVGPPARMPRFMPRMQYGGGHY